MITLMRRVKRFKICNKPTDNAQKRDKNARKALKHREKCQEHGEMVRNGQLSVKKAAEECQITERQMAQYVAAAMKEQKPCSDRAATISPVQ